jgi:hypothetical protein
MATLWIFGDEAGVMPTADTDEVFVAASVGFLGAPPSQRSFHEADLIAGFAVAQALPAVAFVRPFPGYRETLEAKFARMTTLARSTRLLTGTNAKYLTPDGFNPRNVVWG